jgi:endonuclease YncB( thermonuclease family)
VIAVAPSSAFAVDHDCGDFATQAAAQAYFVQQGYGRSNDPERLDADHDGRPCESNPCPCGTGIQPPASVSTLLALQRSTGQVVRVIDGDTIRVRDARVQYTVRLIGIDAPEVSSTRFGSPDCGGALAASELKRLLHRGDSVRLVSDLTQDRVDRYGRLLRYVSRAGIDAGRLMIRTGWAMPYVYRAPFQKLAAYRSAARSARSEDRGAWRTCRGNFHTAKSP